MKLFEGLGYPCICVQNFSHKVGNTFNFFYISKNEAMLIILDTFKTSNSNRIILNKFALYWLYTICIYMYAECFPILMNVPSTYLDFVYKEGLVHLSMQCRTCNIYFLCVKLSFLIVHYVILCSQVQRL